MIDEDALIASVGARLKQLRYAAGLTQEAMALRIECGLRNYQRLETGQVNMSLRTVARLAAALKVNPGELFVQAGPLQAEAASPTRSVTVNQPRANRRRSRP
ncbi:MAG: helix-turn-helix transcriptional regulator [Myxococcales bacterium]|nr:helix-turn-helix domain-containing protein [Myxococcota bacterium]MDW8281969.1 helix-turn-helix transcriptional regulator [Myxococcales bacterium]